MKPYLKALTACASLLFYFKGYCQQPTLSPSSPLIVTEGTEQKKIWIKISTDTVKAPMNVAVTLVSDANRSAENGTDFQFTDTTLTLKAENAFKDSFAIIIKPDKFAELRERFDLQLSYTDSAGKNIQQSFTVYIDDAQSAADLSAETYFETMVIQNKPYEISIVRNLRGYFNVNLKYSLIQSNLKGTTDETSVVKSPINLNENFEYNEFKTIVLLLLSNMPTEVKAGFNSEDPMIDYEVSRIYSNFQRKIKLNNSPEVQALHAQIERYEDMDPRYSNSGVLKIKDITVPTYRLPIYERKIAKLRLKEFLQWRKDSKKLVRNAKTAQDQQQARKTIDDQFPLKDLLYFDSDVMLYMNRYKVQESLLKAMDKKTTGTFTVDSVFFSFFNNTIDKLGIYGNYIIYKGDNLKPTQYSFRANNRSIGLRELNRGKNLYFTINEGPVNQYAIKLSDLLVYVPYKGEHLGYIVKDQSFMLRAAKGNADTTYAMQRRALYDYLSVITFLDFLGVSNAVSNNFIQIEGRARFPLRQSSITRGKTFTNLTPFPMFETSLNASFVNGNNVGGRKATIFSNSAKDTLFYDHFDLVRNYNIKANFTLSALSLQYKELHSRIYLNYLINLYRTAFSYLNVTSGADSIADNNLFSVSHGLSLNFEYRPDFNIGADVRLTAEYRLSALNEENNTLKYIAGKGPFYSSPAARFTPIKAKEKRVYGLEINAYTFLSPQKEKNDGLYFRFAIFTNYNVSQISPYLMAGYATSLKGLVKKKSNDKPSALANK